MKVFKVSGTFQQYGKWNPLEEGFEGYFFQEEGRNSFEGYMDELYECMGYDPVRYIKGVYYPEGRYLAFIKLTSEGELSPLLYIFQDIEQEGAWFGYDLWYDSFFEVKEGGSRILVEEITEGLEQLLRDIKKKCDKILPEVKKHSINKTLLDNESELEEFLENLE